MRHLRTAAIVAVTALTVGAVMMVSGAFAANVNSGTFAMRPGTALNVTCPNALTDTNVLARSETVNCAANTTTTTTTTQPGSTTTQASTTTTTVPATTTTVAAATTTTVPSGGGSAPTTPPVTWCETGLPGSPFTTPPAGAVTVPAGDNSSGIGQNFNVVANTTYWFAPGTHTLAAGGQFGQIQPQNGDIFEGAPGAILDGTNVNESAFTGTASGVTIEYLTVQHFVSPQDQIVVNHDAAADWTIRDNLMQNNKGGAAAAGSGGLITENCLTRNDQYGFQTFGDGGTVTANEVSFNNTDGTYDTAPGSIHCGCAGGDKFWEATNVTVTGNYSHDNGGPGIWADTNNAGFLISGNYIANNWGEGIQYEISYNAQITDNTLTGNTIGLGASQATPGFPDGAIYISESGGDSRVASNYAGQLLISGNVLTNNWGGIVMWENADRFCSSGNDSVCTLVDPATYTISSCGANLQEKSPVDYYDNCRWKTQNVQVTHNTVSFDTAAIGSACTAANLCEMMGLFSDYGGSVYGSTRTVAVTFDQRNVFSNNAYTGPVKFFAWSLSNLDNPVTTAQWQAPVTDRCSTSAELGGDACNSGFGQDTGSTFSP